MPHEYNFLLSSFNGLKSGQTTSFKFLNWNDEVTTQHKATHKNLLPRKESTAHHTTTAKIIFCPKDST